MIRVALLSTFVALAVVVSLPQSVSAQDEFGRPGPYLSLSGIGGSYVGLEEAIDAFDIDPAGGVQGTLGFRALPHLAVEAEVEYLAPTDIEVAGFDVAELESVTATANLKLFLLTGRVQPFLVAGAGLVHQKLEVDLFFFGNQEEDDEAFVGRVGGGLEIYLTPNVAVQAGADVLLPEEDTDDTYFVTYGGGLVFRF